MIVNSSTEHSESHGSQPCAFAQIYEANRCRICALALRMTDHELLAEQLAQRCFLRAFTSTREPSAEDLDCALIAELRKLMPLGALTLACGPCSEVMEVRRRTVTQFEHAVSQLPPTERLVFLLHDVEHYDHERIGWYVGLTQQESKQALHQARLRLRELLAAWSDSLLDVAA